MRRPDAGRPSEEKGGLGKAAWKAAWGHAAFEQRNSWVSPCASPVSVCHLVNITRALSRPLKWNPAEEKFVGDDEANALLDRPRRKGFELPTG